MQRQRNFALPLAAALLIVAVVSTATAQGAPAAGGMPGPGLMPGGGMPQAADTAWIKTKYLNLAYAGKSQAEKLDLYLPNEGSGPFPLIIEIHGGGFMMGDKSGDIAPMLEGLKRGYAVASISYRLSGEAIFPAAVDWFGPLYFSTMDEQFKALGTSGVMGPTDSAASAESKYLGAVVGTAAAQALVERASPLSYLSAKTPPMYIQHGSADRNVPITQSRILAERLAAAIGADKVVFETIEGAGHGTSQFDEAANAAKILDFLDKYLK